MTEVAAPPDAPPADVGELGSRLCRACGMCCSGAFLAYAELEDDEVERLRRHLPILPATAERATHFALPCGAHDAQTGCTLYEERPATCAKYACKLLRGLRVGSVDVETALRRVDAIRTLYARLDAVLPRGGWLLQRTRMLDPAGLPEAREERRRHAETLLDLRAIRHLIARDLENDPT